MNGKRVQSNMGAKNHAIVHPSADKDYTINQVRRTPTVSPLMCQCLSLLPPACPQLVGAAFGAAGQRCMALSTAIFVGETKDWIPEIVQKAQSLTVS